MFDIRMCAPAGTTSVTQFIFNAVAYANDPTRPAVWDGWQIVITLLLIIPTRFVVTFFLSWLANRVRVQPISLKNQFILAFSGLRGGVAFGLGASVRDACRVT
jgi:NhaP-type Na+/H+ or K+/H+ antiporter